MELKEFVKETLLQLTEGVKEAQTECFKHGGLINPMLAVPLSNTSLQIGDKYFPVTNVEFKVGLTENKSAENKQGVGVFLSSITLGAEHKKDRNNQLSTSIEFNIPVVLPFITREGKYFDIDNVF